VDERVWAKTTLISLDEVSFLSLLHAYFQVFCIQRGLWIIPIEIIDCLSTGVAE